MLDDEGSEVRFFAAQALGRMAGRAKSATPHLIRLLADNDTSVRESAEFALVNIEIDSKYLPQLIFCAKRQRQ